MAYNHCLGCGNQKVMSTHTHKHKHANPHTQTHKHAQTHTHTHQISDHYCIICSRRHPNPVEFRKKARKKRQCQPRKSDVSQWRMCCDLQGLSWDVSAEFFSDQTLKSLNKAYPLYPLPWEVRIWFYHHGSLTSLLRFGDPLNVGIKNYPRWLAHSSQRSVLLERSFPERDGDPSGAACAMEAGNPRNLAEMAGFTQ